MKRIFTIVALAMSFNSFSAQAADMIQDYAFWNGIIFNKNVGDRFGVYLEGQNRVAKKFTGNNMILLRPAVRYTLLPDLTVWAGYAFTPLMSPSFRSEHRPWQQLQWAPIFGTIATTFRIRFEERLLKDADASYRMRLMARAMGPLCPDNGVNWVLWDEYMFNFNGVDSVGRGGFNQNRLFIGPAFVLSSHARLEVGYLNHIVNRTPAQGDVMSHISAAYLYLN